MTDFEWSPGDGQSDSGTGWMVKSVIRKNVRFFMSEKMSEKNLGFQIV